MSIENGKFNPHYVKFNIFGMKESLRSDSDREFGRIFIVAQLPKLFNPNGWCKLGEVDAYSGEAAVKKYVGRLRKAGANKIKRAEPILNSVILYLDRENQPNVSC